jgi:hypothetical protein
MVSVLNYIRKLTLTPTRMTQSDTDAVYAAGFSERALYDAVQICCLYNFMNRFVEGVGLTPVPVQFDMEGRLIKEDSDSLIAFKLTQRDLASLVGLTRETVNLILQDFQRRGLARGRSPRDSAPRHAKAARRALNVFASSLPHLEAVDDALDTVCFLRQTYGALLLRG